MIEFESFGKISRLFRDVIITEKIDGTNAAIGIRFESFEISSHPDMPDNVKVIDRGGLEVNGMINLAFVYAQSRKRLITPDSDNFGFAKWVYDNAEILVEVLGQGLHFGEWWGSGIQRGYGLPKGEKRFSLFNVSRWALVDTYYGSVVPVPELSKVPGLGVVPVLRGGISFSTDEVREALYWLERNGSSAAPGFMKPEGVVIYHTAGNVLFKATIENDDQPKSMAA